MKEIADRMKKHDESGLYNTYIMHQIMFSLHGKLKLELNHARALALYIFETNILPFDDYYELIIDANPSADLKKWTKDFNDNPQNYKILSIEEIKTALGIGQSPEPDNSQKPIEEATPIPTETKTEVKTPTTEISTEISILEEHIIAGKEYLDEANTQKRVEYINKNKAAIHLKNDEYWLNDVLKVLPFGLIDKQITGIGATTLEIESPRNSIIVTPTKALAYNKHKKHHKTTIYVGSAIDDTPDVTNQQIAKYLNNKKLKYKKLLVVADSLPRVINTMLESNKKLYTNFFLLVDEIDVLQSDSNYRPKLEIVIDYYFRFKKQNRCLISATINEFSLPELKKEFYTVISKEQPQRNILLLCTDNINLKVYDRIMELYSKYPDEKILVAYNSITNILQIIKLLDEKMQQECGLLCSDASQTEAGEYYTLIKNDKLEKKITFMTSTYFNGIDIDDKCHLITVSNSVKNYSRLSANRLTQIFGRCRNGVWSDTIIYNIRHYDTEENIGTYRKRLLHRAGKIIDLLKAAEAMQKDDENITDLFKRIRHLIVEKADERILNNVSAYKLTRNNIDDEPKISHFNIDALFMELETYLFYYSDSEQLHNYLNNTHKVTFEEDYQEENEAQKAIKKEVKKDLKAKEQTRLDKAREKLMSECFNDGNFDKDAFDILIKKSNTLETIYYRRIKLHCDFFDTPYLSELLANSEKYNKKAYRNLKNALSFQALDQNHPFKKQVLDTFTHGNKYISTEITEILNSIFKYHLFRKNITKYRAVNFLKSIYKTTYTGGKYRIKGINPEELPEPIKHIPQDETRLAYYFEI